MAETASAAAEESTQPDGSLASIVAKEEAEAAKATKAADDKAAADPDDSDGPEDGLSKETDEDYDALSVTKYYDETQGSRKAEVFKDDENFFRWVREMEASQGRRDEDAILGKQIRERLSGNPELLDGILGGKNGQAAKASDEEPEFDTAWVTTDAQGRVIPAPGAPPDAMRKHAAWQRKIQRFAANPEKFVEEAVAKRLEQFEARFQQTEEKLQRQQQEAALGQWLGANSQALYLEGDYRKGMTRPGKQTTELAQAIAERGGEVDMELLDKILKLAVASGPKPAPRKVPPKAVRTPGVAKQPPPSQDEESLFREAEKQGKSFAEVFAEISARDATT